MAYCKFCSKDGATVRQKWLLSGETREACFRARPEQARPVELFEKGLDTDGHGVLRREKNRLSWRQWRALRTQTLHWILKAA